MLPLLPLLPLLLPLPRCVRGSLSTAVEKHVLPLAPTRKPFCTE